MDIQDSNSSQPAASVKKRALLQRRLFQSVGVSALVFAFAPTIAHAEICTTTGGGANLPSAPSANSIACGSGSGTVNGASANGTGAAAFGPGALANTAYDTSVGYKSKALGGGSIDFGATSFGAYAQSTGMGSSAFGQFALARPTSSGAPLPYNNPVVQVDPITGAGTFIGKPIDPKATLATALGNWSIAQGYNTTAVGQASNAAADNATAVGQYAYASSANSTALGQGSWATGNNSMALGQGALSGSAYFDPAAASPVPNLSGKGSAGDTAVGNFSAALGGSSTAIGGTDGTASAALVSQGSIGGVAIGGGTNGQNGAQVGQQSFGAPGEAQSYTSAPGAIAIGGAAGTQFGWAGYNTDKGFNWGGAQSASEGAIAIGSNAGAVKAGDYASGYGAWANGGGDPTCGGAEQCSTGSATATGAAAWASGANSTSYGSQAWSGTWDGSGINNTAIGNQAWAVDASNATAAGQGAYALGVSASAFGQNSLGVGDQTTAIGGDAWAGSNPNDYVGGNDPATSFGKVTTGDTAVGYYSTAYGGNATALGAGSTASAANSTAIGTNANAGYDGSTAIGAGATTTAVNQIMLGTAANTLQAPGLTSSASRAAQVGSTNFVTSDGAGHLATTGYGPQDINNLYAGQNALTQQVYQLQGGVRRGYEGSAVAMATAVPSLPENKQFAISAHWGNFRGQNAMGGAALFRVNNNIVVDAGIGVGLHYGGVGGRAGATFAW